jgi:hypothetical protein
MKRLNKSLQQESSKDRHHIGGEEAQLAQLGPHSEKSRLLTDQIRRTEFVRWQIKSCLRYDFRTVAAEVLLS